MHYIIKRSAQAAGGSSFGTHKAQTDETYYVGEGDWSPIAAHAEKFGSRADADRAMRRTPHAYCCTIEEVA